MKRSREVTLYGRRSLPLPFSKVLNSKLDLKILLSVSKFSNEEFLHLVLLHTSSAAQLYVCFGRCSSSALKVLISFSLDDLWEQGVSEPADKTWHVVYILSI